MPEVWTDSCVEFFCGHAGLPDGHYFNFECNGFVIFGTTIFGTVSRIPQLALYSPPGLPDADWDPLATPCDARSPFPGSLASGHA